MVFFRENMRHVVQRVSGFRQLFNDRALLVSSHFNFFPVEVCKSRDDPRAAVRVEDVSSGHRSLT